MRTRSPLAPLADAVRAIVREADPELPVAEVRTLAEVVAADSGARVTQIRILGVFTALAVVLSGVGLHGLLAFTVSQRSREMGLRMALGARSRQILGLVLGEGLVLVAAGCVLAIPVAYAAGRSMGALLAGIAPFDGPSIAAAALSALLMALTGSLAPALRAVRVDPTLLIRSE